MALALKKRLEEEARDTGRLPWDRQPGESTQAYARFLAYRDQPFTDRSLRKLDISMTLASRWSRRYAWVKRTQSWDDHLLAAADALGVSAQLSVRRAQLDAGLALVTSAHESATRLDRTKQNAESVAALLDAGARHSRIAVGLPAGGESVSLRESASSASVAVAFGSSASGQFGSVRVGPAWLAQPQPNEAERDATKLTPVVQVGEQVLAEGNPVAACAHSDPGKLVDRVVNSKVDKPRERPRGRKDAAKRRTSGGETA